MARHHRMPGLPLSIPGAHRALPTKHWTRRKFAFTLDFNELIRITKVSQIAGESTSEKELRTHMRYARSVSEKVSATESPRKPVASYLRYWPGTIATAALFLVVASPLHAQ